MGIEQFVRDQLDKRELRARSPHFQAEMARENAEFKNVLGQLGKNTLDSAVTIILKGPTSMLLNSLKLMSGNKKYTGDHYMSDTMKLFFGKDGVAHNTLKIAASAVHLAGQGAKIGVRQLFKV